MRGDCTVYSSSASINETFIICAGVQADPGHPCNGDDGAPLVQNGNTVVGILSYQKNCGANPWYSAISVRLSTHFSWLRENAGFQPTTTASPTTATTPRTTAKPGFCTGKPDGAYAIPGEYKKILVEKTD